VCCSVLQRDKSQCARTPAAPETDVASEDASACIYIHVAVCVAMRCSALQCVAVCCSVLQCVAVCGNFVAHVHDKCTSTPQAPATRDIECVYTHLCCTVLQLVAVSVAACAAVCVVLQCVLQCVAVLLHTPGTSASAALEIEDASEDASACIHMHVAVCVAVWCSVCCSVL